MYNNHFSGQTTIFNVQFPGHPSLFDWKTRLIVNDQIHSTHSTKKGFSVDIPLDTNKIKLKLNIGALTSIIYEIEELEIGKKYSMHLKYDMAWGRYSKRFILTEHS